MLPKPLRPAFIRLMLALYIVYGEGLLPAFSSTAGRPSTELNQPIEAATGDVVSTERSGNLTGLILEGALEEMWQLEIMSDGKLLTLIPSQAGAHRVESLDPLKRIRKMLWEDFPAPLPSSLVVKVEMTSEPEQEVSKWRLTVDGLGAQRLTQVRFPIIRGIPKQNREELAVPVWMGQLTREPRRILNGKRLQWHYPGELSMQCLSFGGESFGLYLACNDTASFRKAFAVFGEANESVGCDVVHWPEAGSVNGWAMPYEVLLGNLHGDWFTTAERYRSWATNQAWAIESRVARRAVPPWVTNTALWVWNRGKSGGVLGPATELKHRLGLPVSVFWHWWHGCAYDTGFPEYLPPREGSLEFRRALAKAHTRGVNALVYMNQRLWGMTTESWRREEAATWAVKGPDGLIHPEVYNTFTRAPCASMCLGTGFWRNKYAGIAEEAVGDLGVDGIYMDQACLSLSCFDPTHGHPAGGGTYWVNGFKLLASDIRDRCSKLSQLQHSSKILALAGEGCGEPWLPHLDLMLSLQVSRERYAVPDGWETVPFFHAVYHPYTVLFGNYSSLTMPPYDDLWPAEFAPKEPLKLLEQKFSPQFYLEQARAFVWGQQPTIANFRPDQFKNRDQEMEYTLRLAKLRHRATRYLLWGTMLRPPRIEVAEKLIPISRLSIYAGQQSEGKTFAKSVPLAIGAGWRAPDGIAALALASIADRYLPLRVSVPAASYGLSAGQRVFQVSDKRKKFIGICRVPATSLDIELPPRGACIIEFCDP